MKYWDKAARAASQKYAALTTQRCVPIRYDLDSESTDAVLDSKLASYTPFKFSRQNEPAFEESSMAIREIAAAIRDANSTFREIYPRAIGGSVTIRSLCP